jgi:hypothetical protein
LPPQRPAGQLLAVQLQAQRLQAQWLQAHARFSVRWQSALPR